MATLASYQHFKRTVFAALENKGLTIITLGDVRFTINNDDISVCKGIAMGYFHDDTTAVGMVTNGTIVRSPGVRGIPLDGLALMSQVVYKEEKKLWFYRSNLLPNNKEMFALMRTSRNPSIRLINSRIPREYRSARAADRQTYYLAMIETTTQIADALSDLFLGSNSPAINADVKRATEELLTKAFPRGLWEIIMDYTLDTLHIQMF